MKKVLTVFIVLVLVSCGRKEKTPKEKQERITKKVNKELEYNVDKIVLLSNIEKLSVDKVNATIRGYFKAIYDKDYDLENIEDYQSLIINISKDADLSTKKVSSLMFAYVYEMRTKEEIGDEYIEELQEADEQHNDVYDPR